MLLSNGDGTFQTTTPINLGGLSTIPNPPSVTGDFNGDGHADLAVAGFDSSSGQSELEVLQDNPDGTFLTTTTINLGTLDIYSLAVGDFNGDGRTDLAVAGTDESGAEVEVLLGNGDGTFQAPTTNNQGSGSYAPSSVVAGDLTGDGHADLAVLNGLTPACRCCCGNGDGTFQSPVTSQVPSEPGAAVTGDWNGDGLADLAVGGDDITSGEGEVDVLLGNGEGTFDAPAPISLGNLEPVSLVTGDFTSDGLASLAVAGFDDTSGQAEVEVLLGNGDGTFQTTTPISLGGFDPISLVADDISGDGRTDLALAGVDDSSGENEVEVLLGNGDGTFQTTTPINLGTFLPGELVAGDWSGDGRTDLALAGVDDSSGENEVEVLLANGDGTFQTTTPIDLGTFGASFLVAGDWSGDGRTDLALSGVDSSSGQGEVEVLLANGDGTFQTTPPINLTTTPYNPGGFAPSSLVAGDFSGDGREDLAVYDPTTPRSVGGCAVGQWCRNIPGPDAAQRGLRRARLPRDGRLHRRRPRRPGRNRALFRGSHRGAITGGDDVQVLLSNGNGTFQTTTPLSLGGFSLGTVVASDFNAGDGRTDLARSPSSRATSPATAAPTSP